MKIVNFRKDGINDNNFFEIAGNLVHCLWELYLAWARRVTGRKGDDILDQKGHLQK